MANPSPPPPYSVEDNYNHSANKIRMEDLPMYYETPRQVPMYYETPRQAQRFRDNARLLMGELETPSPRTVTYELPAQLERSSGPRENKKQRRLRLTTLRKFFKGVRSGIVGVVKKGLGKS